MKLPVKVISCPRIRTHRFKILYTKTGQNPYQSLFSTTNRFKGIVGMTQANVNTTSIKDTTRFRWELAPPPDLSARAQQIDQNQDDMKVDNKQVFYNDEWNQESEECEKGGKCLFMRDTPDSDIERCSKCMNTRKIK